MTKADKVLTGVGSILIFRVIFLSLILNVTLMSHASTVMVDFAQSDALLKRFPPGLYADEIAFIDYLPSAPTIADIPPEQSSQFIGLMQKQRTAVPQGALLIVHDVGQNANWPKWVQPMRNYLPDVGWMTLSITIPSGKLYDQRSYEQMIKDRLGASINYLQNKGQFNLVIVSTGTGSFWVAKYLSEFLQDKDDFGFSMISINGQNNQVMQTEKFNDYLSTLTLPILDLYLPKNEYETNQAKWRKGLMLSNLHTNYTQIKMHDSAFGVNNEHDLVTRRVWGWLKVNAAGQEAEVKIK